MVLVVIGGFLFQCKDKENKTSLDPNVFFCDAENISKDGSAYETNGHFFLGAKTRTAEEAYEGKYSCLLNESNKYGMSYTFKDLKPNESFVVTVYRKSKGDVGSIVAQSINEGFYLNQNISYSHKDKNGWDVLRIEFQLTDQVETLDGLKIYVFNGKKEKVYFDNFKIHRIPMDYLTKENKVDTNAINIILSTQDLKTLNNYRNKALEQKVITNNLKKEFDGLIKYKSKTIPISIRFKGDWTDHLRGRKWSYRIKVKNDETFLGLKTFSLQAPKIRDFLHEWVVHELCQKEDILTTRVGYLPVFINGIKYGIYNLEEHFEKQLVESQKRREGPILKLSEDGYWEYMLYFKKYDKAPDKPILSAATIKPFKEKKTLKTEKLRNQFLIAQNILYRYKTAGTDYAKGIDLERMAKMYAILNICNVEHSLIWHNQRHYYNPVNSKLEPIVYDCYPGFNSHEREKRTITGNHKEGVNIIQKTSDIVILNVFNNKEFVSKYIYYLKEFSKEEYLQSFFKETKAKIDSLCTELRVDYPKFKYDYAFLKNNAKSIREELPKYETKINGKGIHYKVKKNILNSCTTYPFPNLSLNAHVQSIDTEDGGKTTLSLINYHCYPLKVVGYGTNAVPDSMIKMNGLSRIDIFSNTHKEETSLSIRETPKKLFYQVVGTNDDSIYSVKVIRWPRPTGEVAYEKMMSETLNPSSKIYTLKDQSITFKKGVHQISNNIIIPEDYLVTFEPGTELIFNKGTFFMSYSAVQMTGTQEQPITIRSTDGTGNGFTVLQAADKSTLNYVVFDGLNTFDKFGWTLTGAVTFFESEVEIKNSVFTNNVCEDGLNIVHSKFKLSKSEVSNTFSDGFDADFCEGEVINSTFANTGNDCLDFSTSTITVSNVEISQSGDKGISCGEASNITLTNITIDGSVIGVASKDNSTTLINSISIANSDVAFSAFQKKPEYGPSTIVVKEHTVNNVGKLIETDTNSKINL